MKRKHTRRGNRIGVVPAILCMFALTMLTCVAVIGTAAGAADIYVNETGWWRAGGAFDANDTPIQAVVYALMGTAAAWYVDADGSADFVRISREVAA